MDRDRRVHDIYHRGIIWCKPDTSLQEVVKTMAATGIHAVMVAEREGQAPVGVVSHTDVIPYYGQDLAKIQASDVMSPDVVSVSEGMIITEATKKILESGSVSYTHLTLPTN